MHYCLMNLKNMNMNVKKLLNKISRERGVPRIKRRQKKVRFVSPSRERSIRRRNSLIFERRLQERWEIIQYLRLQIERGMMPLRSLSIRVQRTEESRENKRSLLLALLAFKDDKRWRRWLILEKTNKDRVFYTLPGGKARHLFEDPLQTCARETLEETGLNITPVIKNVSLLGVMKSEDENIYFYFLEHEIGVEELRQLKASKLHHRLLLMETEELISALKRGKMSRNFLYAAALLQKQEKENKKPA